MKTIKIGKCELLLVKVPEDATEIIVYNEVDEEMPLNEFGYYSNGMLNAFDLPLGNYQFINTLKDISEDDLSNHELVDETYLYTKLNQELREYRFKNYCEGSPLGFQFRIDSLNSLMQANEIYSVNPYKEDWDELCTFGHGSFSKDGKSEHQLFTEAEENTGNWVILKVI